MPNDLNSAGALIRLQGSVNKRIVDLCLELTRRARIKSATRMCEIREYQNRTTFEACLDVDTRNSVTAVSFWFELGCGHTAWHITASVSKTLRDGQETLAEYPERSAANLEELHRFTSEAMDWLWDQAVHFDFDTLE